MHQLTQHNAIPQDSNDIGQTGIGSQCRRSRWNQFKTDQPADNLTMQFHAHGHDIFRIKFQKTAAIAVTVVVVTTTGEWLSQSCRAADCHSSTALLQRTQLASCDEARLAPRRTGNFTISAAADPAEEVAAFAKSQPQLPFNKIIEIIHVHRVKMTRAKPLS